MIKNKLKLGLGILSALLMASGLVNSAYAGVIVFSTDTDITMSGTSGIRLTIAQGSQVDSHIVAPTTITLSITSPDGYTITAPGGYTLNNDSGLTNRCTSTGANQLIVSTSSTVI